MNAGSLKYRITIYKPVKESSAYGNEKITYIRKTTCRAAVSYRPSNKEQDLNEMVYTQYKTLQVYNYVDVSEEDRIQFEGKMYFITSIDLQPDYLRKNITITLVNK